MRAALLLLASWLPGIATADSPPLPAALQNLLSQGVVVQRSFPGPDGLTGWVVKVSGRSVVVFTTASGDYAINGLLVDSKGNNLTRFYEQEFIQHISPADLVSVLAKDQMLVGEGSAKAPLIYVYLDPNCTFCNRFWTALRPYLESGKVRVRWAMLAFLKDTSAGRAAAILDAKDRVAALAEDETKFDQTREEGGIPPLNPVPYDLHGTLMLHSSQMADMGGQGTPLILFHQADGWHRTEGLPQDMPNFIGSLTAGDPDTR